MVDYRRAPIPGGTYFFTVALADRKSTQLTTSIDELRTAFRTVRHQRPFTIEAIVILPDHLHAIFTLPQGDADFALRWRRIKTLFTRAMIAGGASFLPRDRTGHTLWQRRFWEHTIRDARDFARHVDYIHYNPCKHGYVSAPRDWPHSSFHRFVSQGILPSEWGHAVTTEPDERGEPSDHQERSTKSLVHPATASRTSPTRAEQDSSKPATNAPSASKLKSKRSAILP